PRCPYTTLFRSRSLPARSTLVGARAPADRRASRRAPRRNARLGARGMGRRDRAERTTLLLVEGRSDASERAGAHLPGAASAEPSARGAPPSLAPRAAQRRRLEQSARGGARRARDPASARAGGENPLPGPGTGRVGDVPLRSGPLHCAGTLSE